ncbi:hepatitis A virus cellular receptor 2 isoform X4 [Trichechus manatus latirostris]|uniref:Hepatitis A virus cellular receptor 2 isoform X4 n=1 Tax=Trichechus manatus latirostris TaxID=127582 RepID=A0A2Y9QSV6_TRIMA|nr:hepatitis A virus cellular receptor 2 isoform X4 [Trichechus manatus latirostris]
MGIISRQIISRVILWSRETVGGSTQFNWRIKLKLHRNRAILDSSVELMFSRLSFDCVLLLLPLLTTKVTTARTPRRNFTATVPRMLTTKGHGSAETQTRETLHGCNQTQKSTLANELQDPTVTTQITIYIGIGSSAGLALVLIFGALILKWYSHKKEKLQNSSLVSMANLPPSGFVNAVAAGMHSEENIYTIEENVYEVEDSDEYYCYISDWQRP